MLQFIIDSENKVSIADQMRQSIFGGCRWIQIQDSTLPTDSIAAAVKEVMPLCQEKEVFLIIGGNAELAKELNVGGVALGKVGMLPSQARLLLGAAAIVGAAGNSFDDVLAVRSLDVDYIALGPVRESGDCDFGAPLNFEGIKNITSQMQQKDITLPTVAIGGVRYEDLDKLILDCGVNGVAVSSAISDASDIAAETKRFVDRLSQLLPSEEEKLGLD